MGNQFNDETQDQTGTGNGDADASATMHAGVQPGTWHDGQPAAVARGPEDDAPEGDGGDTRGPESGGAVSQHVPSGGIEGGY